MKIYNLTQIYSIKQIIIKKENNRYALKNKSVKIDRDTNANRQNGLAHALDERN